jgi:hypothetical protein
MVGIYGTTSGAVIGSLGARCQPLEGGAITQTAQLPSVGVPFGPIDCPAGTAVLAVQGRQGAVLDQLQLLCGDSGFVSLGTPALVGGATLAPGQIGQAFSLSNPQGSGSDQYALVTATPGVEMTGTEDRLTIAAWVYPTGPGNGSFLSGGDGVPEGGIIVNKEQDYEVARFADGSVRWAFNTADPTWAWFNTNASAPVNTWTHVVVTFDAGVVRTYVNGVLAHTYNGTGTDISSSGTTFRIGGRQQFDGQAAKQNFDGLIDEVMFYRRAITAAEVQQLYVRR